MDNIVSPVPHSPGADRLIDEQEQPASPISLEVEGLPLGKEGCTRVRRIALGSVTLFHDKTLGSQVLLAPSSAGPPQTLTLGWLLSKVAWL